MLTPLGPNQAWVMISSPPQDLHSSSGLMRASMVAEMPRHASARHQLGALEEQLMMMRST